MVIDLVKLLCKRYEVELYFDLIDSSLAVLLFILMGRVMVNCFY